MNNTHETGSDSRGTWEADIAGLLNDLADVQRDLLDALRVKRDLLATGDCAALPAVATREQELITRLEACLGRRQQLLEQAADEGLPADSIQSLARVLPTDRRGPMQAHIQESQHRSRLLQHECLTNWVLVQRSLLHLSQLIEIIATGGRMQPTYEQGSDRPGHRREAKVGGALVDRAV